jgi:hypothetical protein
MSRHPEQPPTPDDRFDDSIRQLLRNSESDVDFVSAAQLRAARARAVDALRSPARVSAGWWTIPGAAVSALGVAWLLAAGHVYRPGLGSGAAAALPQVEVIETLADDKATGVYDDLEFYQWLADADDHG